MPNTAAAASGSISCRYRRTIASRYRPGRARTTPTAANKETYDRLYSVYKDAYPRLRELMGTLSSHRNEEQVAGEP